MDEKLAYEQIIEFISALNSVDLVGNQYYSEHFGNFEIRIAAGQKYARIINDRGELVYCDGDEQSSCRTVAYLNKIDDGIALQSKIQDALKPLIEYSASD